MTADAAPAEQPKAKIFISYSREDLAFADRLEAALKARDFEPLIDRAGIYPFEDWWKRIEALIGDADTVVFVLSPDAAHSDVALKEVSYAASLNKRFAPIVCRRVEESAVPEALRRLNFIFFDDLAEFEASADKLAEALRTDVGWIRRHTEFGAAARTWVAAGKPGGVLLRSPLLEDAERWVASRPANAPLPTEVTQAFIVASRNGASRRRNILTATLAAGATVALVLAAIAFWQRGIAEKLRSEAQARYELSTDAFLINEIKNQVIFPENVTAIADDMLARVKQKLMSLGMDEEAVHDPSNGVDTMRLVGEAVHLLCKLAERNPKYLSEAKHMEEEAQDLECIARNRCSVTLQFPC
jgi:hypothetical protein